jgi:hypothetical protein
MSGLLHRLAARALGEATTVRSDARLPFGTIASRADDSGEDPQGSAAPAVAGHDVPNATSHGTQQPAAPSHQPARPMPSSIVSDASHAGESDASSVTEPAASRLPSAGEAARTPPRGERQVTIPAPVRGAQPVAASEASTAGVRDAPPRHAPPRLVQHDGPQPPPNREALESPRRDAPSIEVRHIRRDPSVLIPMEPPSRRPATRLSADAASQAPSVGGAETNEVHVHIGRIVINAVHDTTPRRPAPASSVPAPLTLDAYLAKRGRP